MSERRERTEAGFVLFWFATTIILLLGIAALVVDIVHGYSEAQQAQNAADAAALAGVVYMPGQFTDAETRADNVAKDNMAGAEAEAFEGTACTPDPCLPNQLQVEVQSEYNTFFATVFGVDTVGVRRRAIAEYDPPVVLGSPDNTFGNTPGTGADQPQFWASVAGPDAAKGGGNAALSNYCEFAAPSVQNQQGIAVGPSVADNCEAGNSQDTEQAQYFIIDKRGGGTLRVDLYDPGWTNTVSSTACGSAAAEAVWRIDAGAAAGSPLEPSRPPAGGDPTFVPVWCTGDQLARHRHGGDPIFNAALPDNATVGSGLPNARPAEYCVWIEDGDGVLEPGETDPDGHLTADEPCDPQYNGPWVGTVGPDQNVDPEGIDPEGIRGDSNINNRFREYLIDHLGYSGRTTFEVYPPDDTPLNPYDNETKVGASCRRIYIGHANPWLARQAGDGSYALYHAWTRLPCTGPVTADGPYVLKVFGSPNSMAVNSFGIAASGNGASNGGADANVTVNAVDRLAVFTNKPTDTGEFYLARVVPSSVPRKLRLTLFDTGDFNCPGTACAGGAEVTIRIKPDTSSAFPTTVGEGGADLENLEDCQYTQPAQDDWRNGLIAPWQPGATAFGLLEDTDDHCTIDAVKRREWNGRYVTVDIPIPDNTGYYCEAAEPRACWLKIEYRSTDPTMAITDVSTWVADFGGNPVRIVD